MTRLVSLDPKASNVVPFEEPILFHLDWGASSRRRPSDLGNVQEERLLVRPPKIHLRAHVQIRVRTRSVRWPSRSSRRAASLRTDQLGEWNPGLGSRRPAQDVDR